MHVGISSYRFDHEGGIERASYELATELSVRGIQVTLVANAVDPPVEPPMSWCQITVPPSPAFLRPVLFSRAATRGVRGRQFDILHNQGACALRQQDIITAHSCHRAWWNLKFDQHEAIRALVNPLHPAVLHTERRNYQDAAYGLVIAVSAGVGRELTRYYDVPTERIRVVPNAVDIERFRPADALNRRRATRDLHGFRDSDCVLLWVGKEFRRKGLEPLIRALPAAPSSAKVLAVGGDDPRPYRSLALRLGVADRIVFAGHSKQVESYFAAGDVFVFPTQYEAFALVTLEAAAAGLPIVTTKVNGTEDFVVDGHNGIFIDRDPRSIALAITRLVREPALRRKMGAAAQHAVSAYSWSEVAAATEEVYEEAIELRAGSR